MAFCLPAWSVARKTPRDVAKRGAGKYQVRIPISRFAALAQLVEHIIRNDGVVGSNPIGGTTFPAF